MREQKKTPILPNFFIFFILMSGIFLFCNPVIIVDPEMENLDKNTNKVYKDQYYIDCMEKLTNMLIASQEDLYDLDYSTFIGGSSSEEGWSIAVGADGSAYITGNTYSSDFYTTIGAFNETYNGGATDLFVCKLSADGSNLEYSTFIGGTATDYGNSIAIDAEGCAYITGKTLSSDFYTTIGAFDETHNGGADLFVCKLDADGSNLIYSTFIGGTLADEGYSIAVDINGCVYITGTTYSNDFNTTIGTFDDTYNGDGDLFVCKLSADGSNLLNSTYIGGTDFDQGCSIAVDAEGCAFITGSTSSSDFNISEGAFDETYNEDTDLFVCKLSADGSTLINSTFIGGTGYELGNSISVDNDGNTYITGHTYSSDFNITEGAFDDTYNGGSYDLFVCKLNANGSSLNYSTFIGGSDIDYGNSIAIDADRCVYITGRTYSSNFNITEGAFDESFNGGSYDLFVSKLDVNGSILEYSTFIGGTANDYGNAIAIDADGSLYVIGITASSDFNITKGAFNETYNGGSYDLFVCKFNIFFGGRGGEGGNDDDNNNDNDDELLMLIVIILVIGSITGSIVVIYVLMKKKLIGRLESRTK